MAPGEAAGLLPAGASAGAGWAGGAACGPGRDTPAWDLPAWDLPAWDLPAWNFSDRDFPGLLAGAEAGPLFWPAARPDQESAWYGHVPFAHWLVSALRPALVVELGTHNGVSFLAFAEAARRLSGHTRCIAVDLWRGDAHAGFYDDTVHDGLAAVVADRYRDIAELWRMRFDQAVAQVADGSIDLLHIDGRHRYEDVREDFLSWRPKLSRRAVVLLHDTEERREDFGVWRFWAEIRDRVPHFGFTHAHGLGVLAMGAEVPDAVARLAACASHDVADTLRARFAALGARHEAEQAWHASARDNAVLRAHIARLQAHIEALAGYAAGLERALAEPPASGR